MRWLRFGIHKAERGQTLILMITIMSVIFLGAYAVIDVGMWTSDRRTAQKDADAAVLSGAQPLLFQRAQAGAEPTAVARVIEWALNNGVEDETLVVDPRLVTNCFGEAPYDGLADGVETEIDADSSLLFTPLFTAVGIEVGAHAKACVGSLITTTGLRPWAMPTLGERFDDGTCSAGSRLIGSQCVANCFEVDGFANVVPSFGSTCRIRSDEPQSIGSINLEDDDPFAECDSGNSSGSGYEENIVEGSPADCSIGDVVDTRQGMATGPTLDGVRDLIATEGDCDDRYDGPPTGFTDLNNIDDFWESFTPPDATPGPDVIFTARECDDDPTDLLGEPDTPRFVTVAVVTQLPTSSGTQPVEILSFAGFFIEKCERLSNAGTYVPSSAIQEATCTLPAPRSRFQIVGRFIQFQQLGGTAGSLNPYGTNVIILVE